MYRSRTLCLSKRIPITSRDLPMTATFAYAKLNARLMPMDRGELFEDPLADALAQAGLGELTGAGTMQSSEGEIEFCGLDIDLVDVKKGVPFICDFLTKN